MLSQKLRNYFHHVVSLETKSHLHKDLMRFDNHKDLVKAIKEKSLYTGLYRTMLEIVKRDLIDFGWHNDLSLLSSKVQVCHESNDTDIDKQSFDVFNKLIQDELKRRSEHKFSDHQKVLQYIERNQKEYEWRLRMDIEHRPEHERTENINSFFAETDKNWIAYKNWVAADYGPPDMSY